MKNLNLLLIIGLVAIVLFSCKNENGFSENKNESKNTDIVENLDDKVENKVGEKELDIATTAQKSTFPKNKNEDLIVSNKNLNINSTVEKIVTETVILPIKNPFYQDNPTQKFAIPKGEKTTIYGEQGTKITVNSDDFIYENDGKQVAEPIEIQLQEYYKLSDILKANLTTTTKDEILETGGMLHLAAFANGKKLALKTGKMVEIGFPFETKKEGMEVFSGERDSDSKMVWTAMTKTAPIRKTLPEEETDEIFYVVENMPLWKGCDKANWTEQQRKDCSNKNLLEFMYKNIKYPDLARENGVEGTAVISFIIEKDGSVSSDSIVRNPGAGIGEEAQRVVRTFPDFIAGRQNGKAVRVRYNLPVRFRIDVEMPRITELSSKNIADKFQNDSTINTASTSQVERYVLGATSLGWINCDRFLNLKPADKTTLFVQSTTTDFLQTTNVRLIFHNIKSIMNSTKDGKNASFGNIPKNEIVTLFALKFENQQYYMAIQETVTKANQTVKLNFEPVTLAKLQATMKQFDTLF